ncbi:hypothetical protein Tco_0731000 [Tanacetum coccineum]
MADDDTNKKDPKGDGSTPDHNSLYYLHPSDYPRHMHISDALTDNNYLDWVQEMENFLFVPHGSQILATKPISSLGNAYHLVVQDEQQRSITSGKRVINEAAAFQAPVKRNFGPSKTVQRSEKLTGKKQEKAKLMAACAEVDSSLLASLTKEQYEEFLKHFASENKETQSDPP